MVWSEAETPFPSNLVSNEYWYQYIYWWFKLILLFITRKNCFRYLKLMSPLKKTIIWPWGQRSRSHEGHYGTRHTALWSCTHIPNINWPISKDKNVMARTRKYYLKNNYLTMRSKIKVPQMSLRYATHRLIVMHPHTKYHWSIWKDKKVMVRTSFAEKKRKEKSD